MIRLITGATVVLAAATLAAQGLGGPKPRPLDETVRYLGSDGKEVATCLRSATLPPRGGALDVSQHRILCTFADGTRLAWHVEFGVGTTGEGHQVLADVDTGAWLEITDRTAIEPRRAGEGAADWTTRTLAADTGLTTVRIETDQFRLDTFRESDHERFRRAVWRRLEADEPALAAFVARLMTTFGKDMHGITLPILADLTELVYAGPALEPSRLTVRPGAERLVALDAEDEAFAHGFGRWASCPDFPHLHE
jgi:hypothetical protein